MTSFSYTEGRFVPNYKAKISINDRSIHFADAVYEVITVYNYNLLFWPEHIRRLKKSLKALEIKFNKEFSSLFFKCKELISINNLKEGIIYIHISRGTAKRNHNWNSLVSPNLIISCIYKRTFDPNSKKISLISDKDIRWKNCHIKTVSLLPNVLLKQKAYMQNAQECVMIDKEGYITEATTSNIWIIKNREIITTPLTSNILAGVTRQKLIDFAKELKIKVIEKKFRENDIYNSDATFISNSSSIILEVKKLNEKKIKLDKTNILKKIKIKILESINNAK